MDCKLPASKLHEKLLNPGLPAKYLWLYLASIEAKNTVYNVVVPQKPLAIQDKLIQENFHPATLFN
jgi:hypothetical protein